MDSKQSVIIIFFFLLACDDLSCRFNKVPDAPFPNPDRVEDVKNNIITSETYITIKDSELDLRSPLNPKQTFQGSAIYPRYLQIFEAKYGFQSNLSILDLLFHEGPESLNYLTKLLNH